MKRTLKILFLLAVGGFALLGTLVSFLAGRQVCRHATTPPVCHEGADVSKSKLAGFLPLPGQEQSFMPVAIDDQTIWGERTCLLFFRAPRAWQEDFCHLHPRKPELAGNIPTDLTDILYASGLNEGCIYEIQGRQWHPFHEGSLHPGSLHFNALRDSSGEYILLWLFR